MYPAMLGKKRKFKYDLSNRNITKLLKVIPSQYLQFYSSSSASSLTGEHRKHDTPCRQAYSSSHSKQENHGRQASSNSSSNCQQGISLNAICSQNTRNNPILVHNVAVQNGQILKVVNGRSCETMASNVLGSNVQGHPTINVERENIEKSMQTNSNSNLGAQVNQTAGYNKIDKLKSKGFPYYHPTMGWINLIPTSYDTMAELGIPMSVMSNNSVSKIHDSSNEVPRFQSSNIGGDIGKQFSSNSEISGTRETNNRTQDGSNSRVSPSCFFPGDEVQRRANGFACSHIATTSSIEKSMNSTCQTTYILAPIKTIQRLGPVPAGDIGSSIETSRSIQVPVKDNNTAPQTKNTGNMETPINTAYIAAPGSIGKNLTSHLKSPIKNVLHLQENVTCNPCNQCSSRGGCVHLHDSANVADSNPIASGCESKARQNMAETSFSDRRIDSNDSPNEMKVTDNVKISVHTMNGETIVSVDLDES